MSLFQLHPFWLCSIVEIFAFLKSSFYGFHATTFFWLSSLLSHASLRRESSCFKTPYMKVPFRILLFACFSSWENYMMSWLQLYTGSMHITWIPLMCSRPVSRSSGTASLSIYLLVPPTQYVGNQFQFPSRHIILLCLSFTSLILLFFKSFLLIFDSFSFCLI